MYFLLFRNYLPLEKGGALHLKKNLNPLHPGILCAKFGWNWPSGSGDEDENVKSLQTDGRTDVLTDGGTDDGQQVIRKAHLSFQQNYLSVCGFSQILSWSIPTDRHAKYYRRACMMYMFSCLPTILTFDIRNNMMWPTLTKY